MEKLTSFSLNRYRSFPEEVSIELKPLTLLYGYNSVGKSSLLRALPLFARSTRRESSDKLELASSLTRGAAFVDIISRHAQTQSLEFSLEWNCPEGAEFHCVRYEIRWLPEIFEQVIAKILVVGHERRCELLWSPAIDNGAPSPEYTAKFNGGGERKICLEFDGLVPRVLKQVEEESVSAAIRFITQRMQALGDRVSWLSSVRTLGGRSEPYIFRPRRLSQDGANAARVLAYDGLHTGEISQLVSRWYERATRHSLEIVRTGGDSGDRFSIKMVPQGSTPIRVDLSDTGEGMGQVLPVLVASALASSGKLGHHSVTAIEHPELHLQPNVHAELAQHFVESVKSPFRPIFVIETHSENFLLRVQLALARGELDPNCLSVYWIRQAADGASSAERIDFDEAGRPIGNNWPPDAFSRSIVQAKEILSARRDRADR